MKASLQFNNANGYATKASAANAMRQAIICRIEEMQSLARQQAGGARTVKQSAHFAGQLTAYAAVLGNLFAIEIGE